MPEVHKRTFAERHRHVLLALASAGLLLLLAAVAPEQMPVVLYKLALPALGGLGFYHLDCKLWPFAQPEGYLDEDWRLSRGDGAKGEPDYPVSPGYVLTFLAACLRQTAMVAIGALGLALGL